MINTPKDTHIDATALLGLGVTCDKIWYPRKTCGGIISYLGRSLCDIGTICISYLPEIRGKDKISLFTQQDRD